MAERKIKGDSRFTVNREGEDPFYMVDNRAVDYWDILRTPVWQRTATGKMGANGKPEYAYTQSDKFKRLSIGAFAVYNLLHRWKYGRSQEASWYLSTIAKTLDITLNTLKVYLTELIGANVIAVEWGEPRPGKNNYSQSVFLLRDLTHALRYAELVLGLIQPHEATITDRAEILGLLDGSAKPTQHKKERVSNFDMANDGLQVSNFDIPLSKFDGGLSNFDTPVSNPDTPVSNPDTPVSNPDRELSKIEDYQNVPQNVPQDDLSKRSPIPSPAAIERGTVLQNQDFTMALAEMKAVENAFVYDANRERVPLHPSLFDCDGGEVLPYSFATYQWMMMRFEGVIPIPNDQPKLVTEQMPVIEGMMMAIAKIFTTHYPSLAKHDQIAGLLLALDYVLQEDDGTLGQRLRSHYFPMQKMMQLIRELQHCLPDPEREGCHEDNDVNAIRAMLSSSPLLQQTGE